MNHLNFNTKKSDCTKGKKTINYKEKSIAKCIIEIRVYT